MEIYIMEKKNTGFFKALGISTAIATAPFWGFACNSGGGSGGNNNTNPPVEEPTPQPQPEEFTYEDAMDLAENMYPNGFEENKTVKIGNGNSVQGDFGFELDSGVKLIIDTKLRPDTEPNDVGNLSPEEIESYNNAPRSPSGTNGFALIDAVERGDFEIALENLQTNLYKNPLLNLQPKNFGNYELNEGVNGQVSIGAPSKEYVTGFFEIYDKEGNFVTKSATKNLDGILQMQNDLTNMLPGEYSIKLNLNNSHEGTAVSYDNVAKFQVLKQGNNAPIIKNMQIDNKEGLKKVDDGNGNQIIRDINGELVISATVSDKEDQNIYFHETDIVGFYSVNGQKFEVPIEKVGDLEKKLKISNLEILGGKTIIPGMSATDYNGASTTKTMDGISIDRNDPAQYNGSVESQTIVQGASTYIPKVNEAKITEPEGDSFSTSYFLRSPNGTLSSFNPGSSKRLDEIGTYEAVVRIEDEYGALNDATYQTITVEEDGGDGSF
jgi:hypothetical protein